MFGSIGRCISRAGMLATLLSIGSISAFADLSFSISGTTTGEFSKNGVSQGSSVYGLSYGDSQGNTSFGPTSVSPVVLGMFSLNAPLYANYNPYDFKLTINFAAPANFGPTQFSADVSGTAVFGLGYASIDFINNGPQHFTFSNSGGSGSFDLTISDALVTDPNLTGIIGDRRILGYISNATFAANPEPAAIFLTSALFGGVLLLVRKKLKHC